MFRVHGLEMRSWVRAVFVGFAATAAGVTLLTQGRTPAELEKAGWDAVRAGQLREAADAFGSAIRLDPRNVRLMLGAGLTAHLLGRRDEARQHLAAALQARPALTEASLLLGQILYVDGDLAGAIQVYEQALLHAPDEPRVLTRLEAWRREAELHERFSQRYGHHFTVLFEGPREEALASRVSELLDAVYWRIGTALGAYPVGITTVILYTTEQFRDVTRSPAWAAGAFDGRIRVPVRGALANPRALERVLAHEFTHALVHGLAPRGVPQWLNEGLAQVFEPAREVPKDAATRPALPLSRLEQSFDGLNADDARLAYELSARATLALIDRAGMAGVLNLLAFIGEGAPFPEAFERATFMSYTEFQRSLHPELR
jgi:hypothetical protein